MDQNNPKLNNVPERFHSILINGYQFNFSQYFNRGIELFRQEATNLLLYTGIFWVMAFLASRYSINFTTDFLMNGGDLEELMRMSQTKGSGFGLWMGLMGLIQIPLAAGFYTYLNRITLGEKPEMGDFLKGFNFTVPLILASLLMGFLIALAIITILGWIYLAVAYGFVSMLIVLFNTGIWSSLETSRKIITKHWWSFLGLVIVLGIISGVLGLIPFNLGVLISTPLTACVMYAAFEDIVYVQHEDGYDSQINEIGEEPNADEF